MRNILNKPDLKSSGQQLDQENVLNLLNQTIFFRSNKAIGGSMGSLMDTSLNQSLKIQSIPSLEAIRTLYNNGGFINNEDPLHYLLSLIDKKKLSSLDQQLLNSFKDVIKLKEDK